MKKYSIAIVGATGLVGTTLLSLMAERHFPIQQLHLVASQQSAGMTVLFNNDNYVVQDLATFDFSKTELAFFCVGNQISEQYVEKAVAAGNIVIDKSYFYRYHKEVPLIVPEVNSDHIPQFRKKGIIANPNCSTIPIAVSLKPIYDAVGIKRINVCTYQSVSGTGKEAVQLLKEQAMQFLQNEPLAERIYPHPIAFNVFPQIDSFQDNGYTLEEMKMVWEMQKMFNDDQLLVNPTAVRVPVFCGHSAAVHLETRDKLSAKGVFELLENKPGIKLMKEKSACYATPLTHAEGSDEVYVGRVRADISADNGLNLWIVSDNLRKGAALNALQIAEILVKDYL